MKTKTVASPSPRSNFLHCALMFLYCLQAGSIAKDGYAVNSFCSWFINVSEIVVLVRILAGAGGLFSVL